MRTENPTTVMARHNAIDNILNGMKAQAEKVRKSAQALEGAAGDEADAANIARITVAANAALTNLMPADEALALAKALGARAGNDRDAAVKTTLGR